MLLGDFVVSKILIALHPYSPCWPFYPAQAAYVLGNSAIQRLWRFFAGIPKS